VSGPSFWEFLLICMIGLVVLGPKRLPQVAQQIGTWIGHARRMTRTLRRQLEEELELDKSLNVRPPVRHAPPRDDVTYSPLHPRPSLDASKAGGVRDDGTVTGPAADESTAPEAGAGAAGADSEQRQSA
jgi:sec-independent protein translocase protein TatB